LWQLFFFRFASDKKTAEEAKEKLTAAGATVELK